MWLADRIHHPRPKEATFAEPLGKRSGREAHEANRDRGPILPRGCAKCRPLPRRSACEPARTNAPLSPADRQSSIARSYSEFLDCDVMGAVTKSSSPVSSKTTAGRTLAPVVW